MTNVGWKYLIMYCVTICIEIIVVYFFYPETQGRTLEELSFRKCNALSPNLLSRDAWQKIEGLC
jgi:hypothetical protein